TVSLIISNNCSTDGTKEMLSDFQKLHDNIAASIYHQNTNIGGIKNFLFVLDKAASEYIMFLGDDDYIDERFLIEIVNQLKKTTDIHCVLPAFMHIDYEEVLLQSGRDLNVASKIYEKGFNNCLENSWRGHQMSGIVLYREGLLDSYLQNKVNNLYPFIYFVARCCFSGKTWLYTDYPVLVTAAPQKDKGWDYEKDGLVSDIFDNYKKLDVTTIQRAKLEIKLLREQSWRYFKYWNKKVFPFIKACLSIEFGKNTSFLTKLVFPIIILSKFIEILVYKLNVRKKALARTG
ncbi:MAG: glycosyltransferase, partial [Candidatus Azobacteroides sp.]|nr:glycosyltransferase [Candidatus Azobacteroides sp.]